MPARHPIDFRIQQVDLHCTATLERPAFEIQVADLYSAIWSKLEPFRVKLPDLKVESTSADPADQAVACTIVDLGAVIRYRLDRIEIWSRSSQLARDSARVEELMRRAVQALESVCPSARVAALGQSLAMHGFLSGVAVETLLARFVRTPEATLPCGPSGVSFSFPRPEDNGHGALVLENSALLDQGLYIRATNSQGEKPTVEGLRQAMAYNESIIAAVGLKLDWRN